MASGESHDLPRADDHAAAEIPATPAPDDAAWLEDDDFEALNEVPTTTQPPGPGLPESIAWLGGVVALQVFCGVIASLFCIVGYVATLPLDAQREFLESLRNSTGIEGLETTLQTPLLVLGQMLFLISSIFLVKLRLGRNASRRLSFSTIPLRHVVLMLLLILPVGVISNTVYSVLEPKWNRLVEMVPSLKALDSMNTMNMIPEVAGHISLPLLLLAIAVVPAIAEELFFRGLIGRGLTARWGLYVGVLLTSILFGMAHIHPLHAAAVVPLGIAIHFVYLATRSFWAPMAFHFLNNAISVFAIKYQTETAPESGGVPAILLLLAFASAAAIAMLMWQMRVRYVLPDGRTWDPGHETVEQPPLMSDALRRCNPATTLVTCAATFAVLAFFTTFVQAAMSGH